MCVLQTGSADAERRYGKTLSPTFRPIGPWGYVYDRSWGCRRERSWYAADRHRVASSGRAGRSRDAVCKQLEVSYRRAYQRRSAVRRESIAWSLLGTAYHGG